MFFGFTSRQAIPVTKRSLKLTIRRQLLYFSLYPDDVMVACWFYIDDLLTLIGETCRDVLYRFAVIKQYIENLADLHLFEGQFRLYEIQRTSDTTQVGGGYIGLARLVISGIRYGFSSELQACIERKEKLFDSLNQLTGQCG